MKDKDNYRQLLAAKLEEIHLEETMPETMPSDEDFLRWEHLANARRSEKRRKFRRAVSIAAVFLLIAVIGVAAIVCPPDAEAGGDGKAVIVDKTNDKDFETIKCRSISQLPQNIRDKFFFFEDISKKLKIEEIVYVKGKSVLQIETKYILKNNNKIVVSQMLVGEERNFENYLYEVEEVKRIWTTKVYVIKSENTADEITLSFMYNDIYINIYCTDNMKEEIIEMIEEALK